MRRREESESAQRGETAWRIESISPSFTFHPLTYPSRSFSFRLAFSSRFLAVLLLRSGLLYLSAWLYPWRGSKPRVMIITSGIVTSETGGSRRYGCRKWPQITLSRPFLYYDEWIIFLSLSLPSTLSRSTKGSSMIDFS